MTTNEAIQHFGSKAELARALDISNGAITQWGDEPPARRQRQMQRLTKGKLKISPSAQQELDK